VYEQNVNFIDKYKKKWYIYNEKRIAMYNIKEVIIVEGVYDKIKLSNFIDSPIFITNGFSVLKKKKMQETIRTFAKKVGIVVLTDSDPAGLKIRAFIKQLVIEGTVLDAYIPEISGKERRKTVAGKAGILGVEGISEEIIMRAIKNSGATICGVKDEVSRENPITKSDFYAIGLTGKTNSALLRKRLLTELNLPTKMSTNMLLSIIDRLLTKEELFEMAEKFIID